MTAFARLLTVLLAALTLSVSAAAAHRPAPPRIANGVRTISIHSAAGVSARVTTPSTVATIVRWFNALPGFLARPCPMILREPATVTFKFHGPGNALTTAVDREPGTCSGEIEYSNDLEVRYPTLADDDFVARVSRLLGVDFDPDAKTAENKLRAKRDTLSLLRLVAVPRGNSRLTKKPPSLLDSAQSIPGTSALVDRHRIWKVHESLSGVVAFEEAHRLPGSRASGVETGDQLTELAFSFHLLPGISSRELEVEMVRLAHGWTGIRADAQDVWIVARLPSEKVPAGVRTIEIRNPARLIHRITEPAQVATIIRWFNALPVNQPADYHCPLTGGPLETIDFLGAGGKVLANASVEYKHGISGPCNPITFTIDEREPEPPLVGGRFLVRVQRLVG